MLRQHYANVLNRPPPPLPNIDDDDVITVTPDIEPSKVTFPITTAELQAALSTSKLSSSSVRDVILVIALLIEECEDGILKTINRSSKMVDSAYNFPSHWKHSIIVSITKKESQPSLDYQRGMAKTCAISKLLNKIVFHRIKSVTESKLLGFQSGLRPGRSTTEQIMTLRFLLHAARRQKRSFTVVFVEYGKAFDSVDRMAIPVDLRHYGVPDPVVADVMQLYHCFTAVVSTFYGLTETFDTTSGVLPGYTLSPHLFFLLVDYILRQSLVDEDGFKLKPANGRRHPAVTLTALPNADDVASTSDSASGAEGTLRRHLFHTEAIGLKLNAAKTKVIHVGYESDLEPILTLDGTTIDVCDIHNSLCLPTLSSKVVIRQGIATAWSAIGKLRPMFHSTATNALKVKLFKSAVETIAAYALESLPLNPTTSNLLDAGHRQMIRAALGINWQNNITNDEVYAKFDLLPLSQTIPKRIFYMIGQSTESI